MDASVSVPGFSAVYTANWGATPFHPTHGVLFPDP